MRPVRILWAFLAAALAASAPSRGADPAATAGAPLGTDGPAIRRSARLSAQGLQVWETADGRLLYLSDNGRYLIRGTAYDFWHGAELTSLDQAEDLAGRIDLKRLALDPADLGALDTGTGPDVLAFVDPHCPHCAALFAELPALADRYRFRLIPLPIGAESQAAVLALHCLGAGDRAAALKALLAHADPPSATGAGCGQAPLCLPPSAIYRLTDGQGPAPAASARGNASGGTVVRGQTTLTVSLLALFGALLLAGTAVAGTGGAELRPCTTPSPGG